MRNARIAGVAAIALAGGASLASTACHQASRVDRAPPGVRCYQLDPGQAPNPAGTVTDVRERFSADGFVLDSIWDSGGRRGTTHLDFHVAGDHLEANEAGTIVRADVVGGLPSPTSWSLKYHDGTYDFTETNTYDATGYTMVSLDPSSAGAPVETRVHFHVEPCSAYDAAVAAVAAVNTGRAP